MEKPTAAWITCGHVNVAADVGDGNRLVALCQLRTVSLAAFFR
jgi:hypothetical protein